MVRAEKTPGIQLSKIRGFSHGGTPLGLRHSGPTLQEKLRRCTVWGTCSDCDRDGWCVPVSISVISSERPKDYKGGFPGTVLSGPTAGFECAACGDEMFLGGDRDSLLPRTIQDNLFVDMAKREQWFDTIKK